MWDDGVVDRATADERVELLKEEDIVAGHINDWFRR